MFPLPLHLPLFLFLFLFLFFYFCGHLLPTYFVIDCLVGLFCCWLKVKVQYETRQAFFIKFKENFTNIMVHIALLKYLPKLHSNKNVLCSLSVSLSLSRSMCVCVCVRAYVHCTREEPSRRIVISALYKAALSNKRKWLKGYCNFILEK